jgi:hypothetical protein
MSITDANPHDSVGTPEGDGEDDFSTPLTPEAEDLITPPGNAPSPYDSDKNEPEGIEKFIDEVSRGEFM